MDSLSVGEFKAKFSEVVKALQKGEEIVITYGKRKEKIGKVIPIKNFLKKKRKLGIWEGKATVKFAKDFKMTDEEFLNS